MNVLIIGGFGYLGQWLLEHLSHLGFNITVVSRRSTKTKKLNVSQFNADINNLDECRAVLKEKNNQIIIYLATSAYYSDHQQNVAGLKNILNCIGSNNIKNFLYISSFHVYGRTDGFIDENTNLSPKTDYGNVHLLSEEVVRDFTRNKNIPHTILRLTNGYGVPKGSSSTSWNLLLNNIAHSAHNEGRIILRSDPQIERDFIWLGSVCNAIGEIASLDKAPSDTFNLSHGKSRRISEIADIVQSAFHDITGKLIPIYQLAEGSPQAVTLTVSSSKLKEVISFKSEERIYDEAKAIISLLMRNKY